MIDLCLCTILFWAVGWGFAFGHEEHALDAIIGSGEFFLNSDDVPPTWLFQVPRPPPRVGHVLGF